jgi:hypothetical protein
MILLCGFCASSATNPPAQEDHRFKLPTQPQLPEDGRESIRTDHYRLPDRGLRHGFAVPPSERQSETVCYTMRSYYVRKDSTNPDSVHADGFSTCQEAFRFQVRDADGDVLYNSR